MATRIVQSRRVPLCGRRLALPVVPEVRPVAFLGFPLVIVVKSAAFWVRAGIVAGGLATARVLGAHARGCGPPAPRGHLGRPTLEGRWALTLPREPSVRYVSAGG